MRGRFGFFGFLFLALLVLVIGGIGYSLGVNAGQAQVVAAPGTVVYPVGYVHPFGFGFGIVGFLLLLLFIGLLFRAFRPRHWSGGPGGYGRGMGPGGWGPGGWGPGGWGGRFDPNDPKAHDWMQRDVPPAFQPMLESWHRRAHGETTSTGQPATGSTGPTGDITGPTGGPSGTPGSGTPGPTRA